MSLKHGVVSWPELFPSVHLQVKVEMHITKKDSDIEGLLLAAKKAKAERLYFPIKK